VRVVLLSDCFLPAIGGIEVHVYSLGWHLAALGHDVSILTHVPVRPGTGSAPPLRPGLTVQYLPGFVPRVLGGDPAINPRTFRALARALESGRFEVVHGHSSASLLVLLGLRAARRLGIPTVLTEHSMTLRRSRPGLVNRALLAAQRACVRAWAQQIIVLNREAAAELSGLGVPIAIIPGGVDCQRFRPDGDLRQQTRHSLGYNDEDIVVGYLGRLVPSKGAPSLLRCLQLICQEERRVRGLFVGGGPLLASLRQQVAARGLSARLQFVGPCPWPETPRYLNAMDIFAFPSYTEACGLALLEAMACGLPMVARSTAGARQALGAEECGRLVDSDEELRAALLQLCRDEGLRHAFGRAARRRAEGLFRWELVAEMTSALYQELAGRTALALPQPGAEAACGPDQDAT